jgi:uncharacterized membrane protein HdeD (DUF308 family)
VSKLNIFVIRAVLGAVFAVILTRFFYPNAHIVYVMGFAFVLVGMAYLLEYLRRRKSK